MTPISAWGPACRYEECVDGAECSSALYPGSPR